MKEKNKLEKLKPKGSRLKKGIMLIFAMAMVFIGSFGEVEKVYAQESTITGNAQVRLESTVNKHEYSFYVTMPDGQVLTGYCIDEGDPAPNDATYSFTATLRSDGYYDVVVHSRYLVRTRADMHPVDRKYNTMGGRPYKDNTYYTQRVGNFKWKPIPKEGKLTLRKSTASNKHLTDLCPENYSLLGAVYGVYTDNTFSVKVGELKTLDENGAGNTLTLKEARYWIKELVAPKGYALDHDTYYVDVVAEKETLFEASDEPLFDPMSIIIEKRAEEGVDKNLSVEGAEYTVKYYKDTILTEATVANATSFKTWVLRTNKNGLIQFYDEFKIGGDEFFKDDNGDVVGLYGTYTIEETKAPKGFAKTEGIISLQNITPTISGENVTVLKDAIDTEKEQTISLTIQKKDSQTKENKAQGYGTLEGAKYEVSV